MTLNAHNAHLEHDPSRVVARFFLPGEGTLSSQSRIEQIVERVLAIPATEVTQTARKVLADFSDRHADAESVLMATADEMASRMAHEHTMTRDQKLVLGSAFTADFAVEGAALCNPSTVVHPSQDGLAPGELRVAVSLRCIGEGHISSIGFAEAVIGAYDAWTFADRAIPLTRPAIDVGSWSRAHFRRALEESAGLSDLATAVLGALPERFTSVDLERAIAELPRAMAMRPNTRAPLQMLREMAAAAYQAEFPPASPLSSRMLMPVTSEEDRGVEDARFVRFTHPDGTTQYRATYTAYDGTHIAPRLILSPDLVSFSFHRLTGTGARNKGMALFPRLVGGRHLAISRTDGENITLAASADGLIWHNEGIIHTPKETWELIQLGNCGAPIETSDGWLLLTHGVGPLRTYSIGALLLDLDDPSKIIGRTTAPLLQPQGEMINGYVPRVVYSCGGIVHRDTLWLPVGVGDNRIRVYSYRIPDLWAAMDRTTTAMLPVGVRR